MTSRQRSSPHTATLAHRPTLRLLSMGLGGPSRPVARLLTRLSAEDGARWFRETLAGIPIGDADPLEFFTAGGATGAQLEQLKDRAKRLAEGDEQQVLAGTLAYLLAVAAAIEHDGRLISSRPRTELADVLLDLAQILDPPWEGVLARAALKVVSDDL